MGIGNVRGKAIDAGGAGGSPGPWALAPGPWTDGGSS